MPDGKVTEATYRPQTRTPQEKACIEQGSEGTCSCISDQVEQVEISESHDEVNKEKKKKKRTSVFFMRNTFFYVAQ
jgi:hypothetical protein